VADADALDGPRWSVVAMGRTTRMILYVNLGIFSGFWLMSMAFCAWAIWWSLLAARGRKLPATIMSLSALIIGCLGTTHFHLTWTAWANGRLQYHYDTRWFFMAPLVLGTFALGCTVWKKVRSSHVAGSGGANPS
jgi:hypothetical protein